MERRGRRQITWSLDDSPGLVKHGERFSEKVGKQTERADFNRFINTGFKQVPFEHFNKGNYWYTGNSAYRIVRKKFTVNISSRSVKFLNETYPVNGRVVDIYYNYNSRGGSSIRFSRGERSARLTGSIEGAQHRPFGPREPGYVKGTLTVEYTVRN